jgi:CubicO group peptidase (beta-lactamase class C family)
LPASTPAAEGVDARRVEDFLDAIEAAPDTEPHSVMILRHGRVITAGWWAPYGPDLMHALASLSKSFTATAVGVAVSEGLVNLDDPVVSYFPEFEADITDPGSRSILVRHIASMASGHLTDTAREAFTRDPAEPVRGFLRIPPDRDPGTVFTYNQPCTYTLAAIVQKLTGQSLSEYLRPRLLDPLGIGQIAWVRDPAGREVGFSGLHVTTDAIARLGLLYLNGGVWEGKRLLSAPGGLPKPRVRISRTLTAGRPTGSRDTGSSSGCRGTDIAETGRAGNSAWCCPNRTRPCGSGCPAWNCRRPRADAPRQAPAHGWAPSSPIWVLSSPIWAPSSPLIKEMVPTRRRRPRSL